MNQKLLAQKREKKTLARRTEMRQRIKQFGDTESPALRQQRLEHNEAIRAYRHNLEHEKIVAYLGMFDAVKAPGTRV